MPRSEKMTIKTQEALSQAVNEANSRNNGAIEPEHLLLALLDQEGGIVKPLLQRIGADTSSDKDKHCSSTRQTGPGNGRQRTTTPLC